jgi:transcriptional regulator with XRE-family HTH domain
VPRLDADRVIKDVGRRVAEVRADLGLTQEQLAERLRMDTNNLQRIETGRQNITIRMIVRLASALGCQPAALFERPRTRDVRRGRPPRRR